MLTENCLPADTTEYSQHEEVGAHELDAAVLVDPVSGLLAAVPEEQSERETAQYDQQGAAHTVTQEVPATLNTNIYLTHDQMKLTLLEDCKNSFTLKLSFAFIPEYF